MVYNIGDTIGKVLGSYRNFFNEQSTIYSFFCRFYFLFTISIMANNAAGGDPMIFNIPFAYINQLVFAITNGFVTSNNILYAATCFVFGF